jgi:signal transduction histidine kinase
MESMGANEMQMQITRSEGAESATRLRVGAGARYERKADDALRPALGHERELDLLVEMAHDLRSPLTSIIALAELIQAGQSGPVTETQHRQLGLIYSAALCLCAAASDVIEIAREGDHLAEKRPVPFSITDIFSSLRDLVKPMVEVRGLELRFESPVPETRSGFPRALSRVLLNLTTNAVKNTDRGSVAVSARAVNETRVEFSVTDTGRGLSPDELAHLFEPFRDGSVQERNHFSSAGLGLAICRKLVAALGSEIKVDTAPSQGTRFSFEVELPPA